MRLRTLFTLRFLTLCLGGLTCFGNASAQATEAELKRAAPVPDQTDLPRMIELSTGFQDLSGGFGQWRDVTLRGTYGLPSHVLQGEVSINRRFNKDGVFVGLSDTYTFDEDWYGSIAVGFGDGAFYLPRYRVDATLYRKLLPQKNLVASIGAGQYKAPDGHTDNNLSLGLVYYFDTPFVAEVGLRLNSSNPGAIRTQQQFLALTYGRVKQNLVTLRHAWGQEGYQTIGVTTQLVNFASKETSISWRHWFAPRTGVMLGANSYTNPSFNRNGLSVGIFHEY